MRIAAAGEGGFAMVTVLAVLLVGSLVAVAAVSAADNETVMSGRDKDRKRAYAAAEAGVNDYLARLVTNVDYWRKCGNDPFNASLNQRYTGSGTRKWARIPGANAEYSVEVLPANNQQQCSTADPMATMIDTATGTFRVRSTGRVGGANGDKRSIVVTFKRRGFLDYVYFTDFEVMDPEWSVRDADGQDTRQNLGNNNWGKKIVPWAKDVCAKYYREGIRQNAWYQNGQRNNSGSWTNISPVARCGEINFVTGDRVNGPFHTNDEILVCGTPSFGRFPSDDIEVSAPTPGDNNGNGGSGSASGWRNCGSGAPQVNDPTDTTPTATLGTWRKGSPLLEMPPSNTKLRDEAMPSYRFVGTTKLTLSGTNIVVRGTAKRESGQILNNGTVLPAPKDGVIYVGNDPAGSCPGYNPVLADNAPANGCGDLWIRGTNYQSNLTFAAANDIVIDEDITRDNSKDVLLGLIADQWIRVHHPVTNVSANYDSCSNNGGPGTITIHAALLAVNDSFTVDRYWCGASLGTLNVTGAIAQRYRGTVGTSGNTGYIKNYTYDDRLKFRTPPKFLDPVQASWKVQSQVEQVPAT